MASSCLLVNYTNSAARHHREMDSIIPTEFMTEILNGILATNQPPSQINWECIPLPELLLFVEKVTNKAGIDYNTAMVALVLLSRLKRILPKNAHGEYGTCHRLFLSAILVASKDSTQHRLYSTPPSSQEDLPLKSKFESQALLIENRDQPSPPNSISSSSSSSDGEEDDETTLDDTNCNLAEISGIFTVQEVNQMEKDFRKLLGRQIIVNDKDVKDFVECNKYALGFC